MDVSSCSSHSEDDKDNKEIDPATLAFRKWGKSLPWGERNARFAELATACKRSLSTVRAWYTGTRAIPGRHAVVIEYMTGGVVGRRHFPSMYPEMSIPLLSPPAPCRPREASPDESNHNQGDAL